MAADILIYGGEVIPVGSDQQQHVEMTRELAGKYNRAYGVEQFVMPQAYIVKDVATVPGIDGRKMSKSYDNHIPLFGTPDEIKKRVMSIVTDSARPEEPKNPDENNIYQIHKLFLTNEEDKALRAKFEAGGYGYKDAKEALLQAILDFTGPMREKYEYYQTHKDEVEKILEAGAEKARSKAQETMKKVKQQTGLSQK
jgi:tryptophanyl-tRNA synthetase